MSSRFLAGRCLKQLLCRQRGISLVELLVSMAIALLILAGVVQTFLTSKQAYLYNEQLAFIQENARFAIDRMTREIREAGYLGCAGAQSSKVANTAESDYYSLLKQVGLEGFEAGISNFPDNIDDEVRAGTDALIVRRARVDQVFWITESTTAANIKFNISPNTSEGTVWVIASPDCQHVGIFVQSDDTTNETVEHNAGGSPSYNCTETIHVTTSCDCSSSLPSCNSSGENYPEGSEVSLMSGRIFYIASSLIDDTVPVLYQRSLASMGREELVVGVDDLQFQYGINNDGNGGIDRYVTADEIADDDEWGQVGTVRVQMVMRSQAPVLPEPQSQTYLGVVYNDRYLRQVVSSTIQIRNFIAG